MDYHDTRQYLLGRPESFEDFPFGPDVAVFKIATKMFATLVQAEGIARMNLKCDPHEAAILRDIFSAVIPGYHMNKRHWNTVILDGSIPRSEIERMIDNSYALVVRSLPSATRRALEVRQGRVALYREPR
jgi:predicted DNA-binding protein (MmcQ/YjbR family)